MLTKQTKFILAIALQVIIIFAIIIFKLSVLTGGTDVLLKITPVDPRDLLRGDYATFQYSISTIDSQYAAGKQIRNGDTVYAVLLKRDAYWTAQSIQKNRPAGTQLFIKGKVESGGLESKTDPYSYQQAGNSSFHIVYGIEQYFIPEGEGRTLSFAHNDVAAQVAVDDEGNAVLKQVYVDGKPWP